MFHPAPPGYWAVKDNEAHPVIGYIETDGDIQAVYADHTGTTHAAENLDYFGPNPPKQEPVVQPYPARPNNGQSKSSVRTPRKNEN